jgi:hypothetical protein
MTLIKYIVTDNETKEEHEFCNGFDMANFVYEHRENVDLTIRKELILSSSIQFKGDLDIRNLQSIIEHQFLLNLK